MLETILAVLIFLGLIATHIGAYRLGRAIGERRHRRESLRE